MGASNAYLIPKSSPFVASNTAPVYTKAEAIPAITTSISDDVVSLNKITAVSYTHLTLPTKRIV